MLCFPRALRRQTRETRARSLKRATVRADVSSDGDESLHKFSAQISRLYFKKTDEITEYARIITNIRGEKLVKFQDTSNISTEKLNDKQENIMSCGPLHHEMPSERIKGIVTHRGLTFE